MPLSKGQQEYIQQAGQMAFGKMKQELGPETPAEAAETEKGISGEPTSYTQPPLPSTREKEIKHEEILRKGGYTHRANALTQERTALELNAQTLKNNQEIYKAKTMRSGIQLAQAGDHEGGMALMNSSLPEGQKVTDIIPIKNGKARIISEDQPEGFVVVVNDMITAFTSAETQYRANQDRLNQKIRANTKDKIKAQAPKRATDGEVLDVSHSYKSGTFDDLAPGLSEMSDAHRDAYVRDLLNEKYVLQEQARQKGTTLTDREARERASKIIKDGIGTEPGTIYGTNTVYTSKPRKKEVEDTTTKTKGQGRKKKGTKDTWSTSHMSVFKILRANKNNDKYSDEQLHAGIK